MSRYPKIEFERLQMFFGEPYVIDLENARGTVTITQPKMDDLLRIGENRFFSTINVFTTNTTVYRSFLWDIKKDWNEVTDFELWRMLLPQSDPEVITLLFDGLDLAKMSIYEGEIDGKLKFILYDEENNIEINEDVYQYMHQYLQNAFNMHPEELLTDDQFLKPLWIRKDKVAMQQDKKKEEKNGVKSSSIQPLISACLNHPGFKYKLDELRQMTIAQFYDSVSRLQIYENSRAAMNGMYSGFVDGSKIKPETYNFMKDMAT